MRTQNLSALVIVAGGCALAGAYAFAQPGPESNGIPKFASPGYGWQTNVADWQAPPAGHTPPHMRDHDGDEENADRNVRRPVKLARGAIRQEIDEFGAEPLERNERDDGPMQADRRLVVAGCLRRKRLRRNDGHGGPDIGPRTWQAIVALATEHTLVMRFRETLRHSRLHRGRATAISVPCP